VDDAALSAALAEGRVIAAGLVCDDEPPAQDHPLLDLDQVALTPHIAGLTQQAAERMAVTSIQNVLDFFAGRLNSDLIVNKDFPHG
jgi:D-3-phosphoglycerate dehydrogenase / 2-oxoglutarate reductase